MSMESEHKKEETGEDARNSPEAEFEDGKTVAEAHTRKLSSTSFLSSSSSCSSFEIEITDNIPFDDPTQRDGDLLQGQESVSSPAHAPQWSLLSSSPPHGTEDVQVTSPTVQTMDNSGDYDPNRIPSSIFSTKPANASEWSTASNDSLFSLHMGNNSFSVDQMLWKSGELSRLDEWEISDGKYSLPPVMEVSAQEESSVKSSSASRVDNEGSNNIRNNIMSSAAAKMACTSSSTLSDASGRSSSSFAFPVLVSASGKTSSLERVEEKPEEPQLQSQESKPPQKSSIGKWFSWFSCLPRCC